MRKLALALVTLAALGCTQETQNKLGRAVQNWTGTNGVLEIYAGDTLVKRFVQIDKLSTALGTRGRPQDARSAHGAGSPHTEATVRSPLGFASLRASLAGEPRRYRFGYGVLDANQNGAADPGEKKIYFEVSNFSTYVFYEDPNG